MKDKIYKYIKDNNMFNIGDKVVIGVSGGKDSVCLFDVLLNFGVKLEVVHVNHCIRGEEAIRDQNFVKSLCEKNNVKFHLYTYNVPSLSKEQKMSEELVGRNCRRMAFEDVLNKTNAKCIALAHHKNDRAETMIFNICRGAGITGISSIKPINSLYVRPLLAINRDEIEQYIEMNNLEYVEDSTNDECIYTRNKVRHNILKEMKSINEKAVDNINRTIDSLSEISDYIELETNRVFNICVEECNNGLLINKIIIEKYHPVLQKTVLRKCIEIIHGSLVDISEKHIYTVIDLYNHGNGKYVCLPKGIIAKKIKKNVFIFKK